MADTLSNLQNMAKNSISEAAKPAISFAPTALEQSQKMAQASTGKADTGVAGASVSNIAEQVAEDQTAKQQAELQQQASLAERGQQTEEEQQYLQLADQELEYRNKGLQLKQEFNNQLSKLIQDFKEKGDTLDLEKSKAAAEQIGTLMRLLDDKYVNNLKMEGAKRRLQNMKAFKEAAIESQFSNQLGLLEDDFSFKTMLRADDREFKMKMEQMGFQQALDMVEAEIQGNKDAMVWRGAGGLLESGIQVYGMTDKGKSTTATALESDPVESGKVRRGQQSTDTDGGVFA
jgi:AraC-like DNA-binding protein